MAEEQGLSPENRALIERAEFAAVVTGLCITIAPDDLNRLLDAARSEGPAPVQGGEGEPLPCPFCGSRDLKTVTDDGAAWKQCRKCEATGPTTFKRQNDGEDWNTRSEPRPSPEGLVEALKAIVAIKREPIGDTGFATGPLAHFQAAQRIATEALAAFQSGQEEKQP